MKVKHTKANGRIVTLLSVAVLGLSGLALHGAAQAQTKTPDSNGTVSSE